MTPEHVAASTAAVTRILAYGPDQPYDLASLLLLSGGAAPPAAGHHRHVCGRCDQHLRQPGAGRRLVGVPQMGAEGVAWATTGTRWMIAAIMLIFVAALTPGFRRSPPAAKGKRVFSSKSEPAPPFPTSPNGAVSTSPSSSPWVSIAANAVYGYSVQVMGVCFMFYLGIATATSVRVAEAIGQGNQEEVKNAGRLGVAATMVMGVILGVLLVSWPGQSRGFWCGRMRSSGASRLRRPLRRCSGWRRRAVFDGLQATASFALRAQGMVWLPSAIHLSSFFVVMIPVCYWLAIPLGRGAAGVLEGRLSASSWPGRRSSSCWNGKRRAPVWNAPPDPDRSPWGSEP